MLDQRIATDQRAPRRRAFALCLMLVAGLLVCTDGTGLPAASALDTTPTTNPWLQRRVLGLAHAGGEDEAPHSTLFAYHQAMSHGVSMLDLDVQLTGDGVLVVLHNDTVDRTTNGTGSIASMTYAQANALDAAYWYSDACWACHDRPLADYRYRGVRTGSIPPPAGSNPDDFAIPSVRSMFETFPDMPMDIEIKGTAPGNAAAVTALADLIHEFHRADRTVVASFDTATLDSFSTQAPDVATSATLDEVTQFFLHRQPLPGRQVLDVPPTYDLSGTTIDVVTPQFVRDAHAAGMAVWVWMNGRDEETAEFYGHLLDMGVDGINAARPGVLMDVLHTRGVAWDPNAPPVTSAPQVPTTTSATLPPALPSAALPILATPRYTG